MKFMDLDLRKRKAGDAAKTSPAQGAGKSEDLLTAGA